MLKLPEVWVEGGLVTPFTRRVNVWAPMAFELRFRLEIMRVLVPDARAQVGLDVRFVPVKVAQLEEVQDWLTVLGKSIFIRPEDRRPSLIVMLNK
jgi:hypothetical protein